MPRGVYPRKLNTIKAIPAKANETAMQISLVVPQNGVILKLNSEKNVIGTILMDAKGFTFIKSNGKLKIKRTSIGWVQAAKLFESGFLG